VTPESPRGDDHHPDPHDEENLPEQVEDGGPADSRLSDVYLAPDTQELQANAAWGGLSTGLRFLRRSADDAALVLIASDLTFVAAGAVAARSGLAAGALVAIPAFLLAVPRTWQRARRKQ
jgi:hypothetical protein